MRQLEQPGVLGGARALNGVDPSPSMDHQVQESGPNLTAMLASLSVLPPLYGSG